MGKLMTFVIMMLSTLLFAQNDTIGWGRNSNYDKIYNIGTAIEIKGKIVAIEQIVPVKGISSGTQIIVESGSRTIPVQLGPKWYMDKQAFQIKVNDKIIVRGSIFIHNGKPVIIARKIVRGNNILKMRNENGIPKWAGKLQQQSGSIVKN